MRLYDTSNEIIIRSDAIVQALVEEIRLETPHLFQVCESVALVDMICSFAKLSITHDYIRPEITNTLALRSARHPVLDKVSISTSFSSIKLTSLRPWWESLSQMTTTPPRDIVFMPLQAVT